MIRIPHVFLLAAFLFGCSSTPCYEKERKEREAERTAEFEKLKAKDTNSKTFVYKYDGTLQCKQGQEIPLKEMEKRLKGIPILSRSKKSDGMMRVQACGTPTGQANVYEIPRSFLGEAMKRDFLLWEFQ